MLIAWFILIEGFLFSELTVDNTYKMELSIMTTCTFYQVFLLVGCAGFILSIAAIFLSGRTKIIGLVYV